MRSPDSPAASRVPPSTAHVPMVAVLVAAHFLDWSSAWSRWQRLPVGLLAVPVGFFTGYPYAILNWPPFLEHLGRMGAYAGTREFDPVARFNYIAGYSAESGFGLLFTIVLGDGPALLHSSPPSGRAARGDAHRRLGGDARAHGTSVLCALSASHPASRRAPRRKLSDAGR